MNQIQWKRFTRAARAVHDDLLAGRSALLPAGRIIGDGIERTDKFCVEDVQKLLRKFLLGFQAGTAARLKILNSNVVIFRLGCANETNHGATWSLAAQFQRIRGWGRRGACGSSRSVLSTLRTHQKWADKS